MKTSAEHVTEVRKWGNSGGILLPREWLGKQVRIVLIDRTLEIRKEVLTILEPYLEDVIGVYLVGSYARGDQREESDIDILVISKETRKSIKSGKYEIEIMPMKDVLALMQHYPMMIYPKFVDARPILNKGLLNEFRSIKLAPNSMQRYLNDCRKIMRIDKGLIEKDKSAGDILRSVSVVYSSILRLRALYMMKQIAKRGIYSTDAFEAWAIVGLGISHKDWSALYEIYKAVRDNRRVRTKVPIVTAEKLITLLEKEVMAYGKKEKKA